MAAPLLFLAALLSVPHGAASEPLRLELRGDTLRIGDIAYVASGGDLVVAKLGSNVTRLELSEGQRANLLRNRVPGVAFALRHKGKLLVVRGAARRATKPATGGCFATRTEIAAGRYLSRADVAETACIAGVERRLRYDAAARAPFAHAPIPPGSYLGKIRLPEDAPVAAGQTMTLRTAVGPVLIERQVTTVQAGRRGKRIFVRTDDGELLASRLSAKAEGMSR